MQVEFAAGVGERLLQLAAEARPREACALLGGRSDAGRIRIERVDPLPNLAVEPDRFRVDPIAAARSIRQLRHEGLSEVGWFHSHPDRPPQPSRADLDGAWPDLLVVIAGWLADGPRLRCYWPRRGRLELLPEPAGRQRTTSTSSISNTSVELPGIFGGLPASP